MRRAIVVGAGMSGLVAARVLADHLDEVVVVERDRLPPGREDRPGVPQGVHIHVLLARGYRELTRLFPTFDQRLGAAGAPAIDWARDALWVMRGGQAPRFPSPLRSRTASRGLFESTLRALTLERPNVRLMDGQEMTGLVVEAGGVRGVRVRTRPSPVEPGPPDGRPDDGAPGPPEDPITERHLDAWLVVDASGRGSRVREHLDAAALPAPGETVIDASLFYATRTYRIPAGERPWMGMLVRDRPPWGTRGGGLFPLEGGRWVVTLGGAGEDRPPTDERGFVEFASSLVSPILADAIRDAEPLTPVRGWGRTANRWRHVERMPAWPPGLVLVGDALCALNPVYGQGMSVAAMEGPVLGSWLGSPATRASISDSSAPRTMDLMRRLARTARLPWFLATGEDARVRGVTGTTEPGLLERTARRYVDEVYLNAASHRPTVRRFAEVSQLVRPPAALFDPLVALEVAAGLVRRRSG